DGAPGLAGGAGRARRDHRLQDRRARGRHREGPSARSRARRRALARSRDVPLGKTILPRARSGQGALATRTRGSFDARGFLLDVRAELLLDENSQGQRALSVDLGPRISALGSRSPRDGFELRDPRAELRDLTTEPRPDDEPALVLLSLPPLRRAGHLLALG